MKIRKNDNVIVLQGKDKGKTGKVLHAMPGDSKVIVEGVNVMKRHRKSGKEGKGGEIIDVTMPIHVSNVAFVGKDNKPTRVGYQVKDGKKVRVDKKSGTKI